MDKRDIVFGILGGLVVLWTMYEGWRERRWAKSLLDAKDKEIEKLLEANRHLSFTVKAVDANDAQLAVERDIAAQKYYSQAPMPTPEGDNSLPESHPVNRPKVLIGGNRFKIIGVNDEVEQAFMSELESDLKEQPNSNVKIVKG